MELKKSKSLPTYFLMLLVLFLALNAMRRGFLMIIDPSGDKLNLPLNFLVKTPFLNYTTPGTILFILLGVFPLLLIFPMMSKQQSSGFGFLNIYAHYHWVWTYTLYISIILIAWVDVQLIVFKNLPLLQNVFGLYGLLMLIVVLLPAVKRDYRIEKHKINHRRNKIQESK